MGTTESIFADASSDHEDSDDLDDDNDDNNNEDVNELSKGVGVVHKSTNNNNFNNRQQQRSQLVRLSNTRPIRPPAPPPPPRLTVKPQQVIHTLPNPRLKDKLRNVHPIPPTTSLDNPHLQSYRPSITSFQLNGVVLGMSKSGKRTLLQLLQGSDSSTSNNALGKDQEQASITKATMVVNTIYQPSSVIPKLLFDNNEREQSPEKIQLHVEAKRKLDHSTDDNDSNSISHTPVTKDYHFFVIIINPIVPLQQEDDTHTETTKMNSAVYKYFIKRLHTIFQYYGYQNNSHNERKKKRNRKKHSNLNDNTIDSKSSTNDHPSSTTTQAANNIQKPICISILRNFYDIVHHHHQNMNTTSVNATTLSKRTTTNDIDKKNNTFIEISDLTTWTMEVLQEYTTESNNNMEVQSSSLPPPPPLLQCIDVCLTNCYGLHALHNFIYQSYVQYKQYQLQQQFLHIQQYSLQISKIIQQQQQQDEVNVSYNEYMKNVERLLRITENGKRKEKSSSVVSTSHKSKSDSAQDMNGNISSQHRRQIIQSSTTSGETSIPTSTATTITSKSNESSITSSISIVPQEQQRSMVSTEDINRNALEAFLHDSDEDDERKDYLPSTAINNNNRKTKSNVNSIESHDSSDIDIDSDTESDDDNEDNERDEKDDNMYIKNESDNIHQETIQEVTIPITHKISNKNKKNRRDTEDDDDETDFYIDEEIPSANQNVDIPISEDEIPDHEADVDKDVTIPIRDKISNKNKKNRYDSEDDDDENDFYIDEEIPSANQNVDIPKIEDEIPEHEADADKVVPDPPKESIPISNSIVFTNESPTSNSNFEIEKGDQNKDNDNNNPNIIKDKNIDQNNSTNDESILPNIPDHAAKLVTTTNTTVSTNELDDDYDDQDDDEFFIDDGGDKVGTTKNPISPGSDVTIPIRSNTVTVKEVIIGDIKDTNVDSTNPQSINDRDIINVEPEIDASAAVTAASTVSKTASTSTSIMSDGISDAARIALENAKKEFERLMKEEQEQEQQSMQQQQNVDIETSKKKKKDKQSKKKSSNRESMQPKLETT